jgi:nucleoside-diphosphate-sugar epimerase
MSAIKKILVTGANGYVGNYMIRSLASKHPDVQVVGMSRRGTPRNASDPTLTNLSYIKGNCLQPESFEESLRDVDSVIHTVGTLFGGKGPLSYTSMNRDAAVNMARVMNKFALENGCKRNFVMISSAKSLPWT